MSCGAGRLWTVRTCAAVLCACVVLAIPPTAFAFEATLITKPSSKDIKERLEKASLVLEAKEEDVTDPTEIVAAAQADYARLISVLYEAGYYAPVVNIRVDGAEAATLHPFGRPKAVGRIDIVVQVGQHFRLGRLQIAPLAPATELPEDFKAGAVAHLSVLRTATRTAVDAWRDMGHAKVDITQERIIARHAEGELDAEITLDPGPRVTFGDLTVNSTSSVPEDRIREITALPHGDVFDPDSVDRALRRLRRAGAFSLAALKEADKVNPDQSLDMILDISDSKPRRIGFGAELQTEEGLNLSTFFLHRNLFGGAERLRLDAEIKGIAARQTNLDYRLQARFTRPATLHPDTDLVIFVEANRLDEPLYILNQAIFSAGFNRYINKHLSVSVALAPTVSDIQDGFGNRRLNNTALATGVVADYRGDLLNPKSGGYANIELMPYLGGENSTNGARLYLDGRAYRSLGQGGTVFAGRLQLGSVVGSSIQDTPSNWLFLSGGSNTVRGTGYQSNFVTTGSVASGGRSFVGFSGEARVPVRGQFSAVAFYDAGYIGASSLPDRTGQWHSGAGLGLRYDTGVGPIRFDVASHVSGPGAAGVQVYIGIGQAF